jgi:hypothetical protein
MACMIDIVDASQRIEVRSPATGKNKLFNYGYQRRLARQLRT